MKRPQDRKGKEKTVTVQRLDIAKLPEIMETMNEVVPHAVQAALDGVSRIMQAVLAMANSLHCPLCNKKLLAKLSPPTFAKGHELVNGEGFAAIWCPHKKASVYADQGMSVADSKIKMRSDEKA